MNLEEALKATHGDGVYIVEIRPALPAQAWMPRFLEQLLASGGNVQRTLDAAPSGALPSKPTLYKYRRRNPDFRSKWDEIVESFAKPGATNGPSCRPE